jgi:hypothetical protein
VEAREGEGSCGGGEIGSSVRRKVDRVRVLSYLSFRSPLINSVSGTCRWAPACGRPRTWAGLHLFVFLFLLLTFLTKEK